MVRKKLRLFVSCKKNQQKLNQKLDRTQSPLNLLVESPLCRQTLEGFVWRVVKALNRTAQQILTAARLNQPLEKRTQGLKCETLRLILQKLSPEGHSAMDNALACHTGGQSLNPDRTEV